MRKYYFAKPRPNSDKSTTSSQIRDLSLSYLILFTLHHKQYNEHIQGSIQTKVSKLHYMWTNTIIYRANIMLKHGADLAKAAVSGATFSRKI